MRALSFNQDGSLLAIGGDDKKAMLWNIKKDELFKKLSGHDDDVKGISFSPDGSRVATTSKDKSAIIWDAATGDKIKALNGHSNNVNSVAYSPEGKYLVTGNGECGQVSGGAFRQDVHTVVHSRQHCSDVW